MLESTSNHSTGERRLRVLFVDDEDEARTCARFALEKQGFEIVDAPNGHEALRLFLEGAADVVVTDLFMPNGDGLELIQELLRYVPPVPVVAISGGGRYNDRSALQVAGVLGVRELLTKPFTYEQLIDAVRRSLARSSA
jgi:CheY-like chemotaxis protein